MFLVGSSWFWYEASAFGNPTYHAISANNFETGGLLIFLLGVFGRQFFPSNDPSVSTLLSLGTFAIAWLVRPLGAIPDWRVQVTSRDVDAAGPAVLP